MRRRRLPDTRPRWNDPDLLVELIPGWLYTAAEVEDLCKKWMSPAHVKAQHWERDPTYDLRKNPFKRRWGSKK